MGDDLDNVKLRMLTEFKRYLNEVFQSKDADLNKIRHHLDIYFNDWNTCRVDIVNTGSKDNNIKFSKDYPEYKINYPGWLNTSNGKGCVIQSKGNKINVNFDCVGDGKLNIVLRGVDFRDFNRKRVPVYIDFTKFLVNDKVIFDNSTLIAHDKAYPLSYQINDGDQFNLYLEFKTIYDYYPQLELFCKELKNKSADMDKISEIINFYIEYEKSQISN